MAIESVQMDKNNQGSQPAALTGTSMSSPPSPVIDSMNRGGSNFASNTGFEGLPDGSLNSMNQRKDPAPKSGPGGQ